MLPPFRLGAGGRVGSGRQWMSWITLDDIVALYRFLLDQTDVSGPVNGVAPAPVTNTEFTRDLGRALGRPTILPVPALALRAALGEMGGLLLESQRVVPRAALAAGFQFRHPELPAALAALTDDLDEELVREQVVPKPPEEVFRFFSDPANLEALTPAFLRFRVLGSSTPTLQAGTTIDYRLSLHGVPVRWRSAIDEWQPSQRFVDRQVKGPYRKWVHTHEFEARPGGTLVRDHVRYALPVAPLGDLVAGRMVARDLGRIFAYRRVRLRELLG
jgi:ligand-binding SRPBCC domain-containing protein